MVPSNPSFSNIVIVILDLSIAPCKVRALNLLCFILCAISFLLSFILLSIVIALHNIAKAIVVSLPVKSNNFYYCKVKRGIALWGAMNLSTMQQKIFRILGHQEYFCRLQPINHWYHQIYFLYNKLDL